MQEERAWLLLATRARGVCGLSWTAGSACLPPDVDDLSLPEKRTTIPDEVERKREIPVFAASQMTVVQSA